MGKSLDAALVDFNARFAKESRRQFILCKAPLRHFTRSKLYLRRSFPSNNNRVHRKRYLHVSFGEWPIHSNLAIAQVVLVLWDRKCNRGVCLENGKFSLTFSFAIFTSVLDLILANDSAKLHQKDFEVHLQVVFDHCETSHQSDPSRAIAKQWLQVPKLSRKIWNALLERNEAVWTKRIATMTHGKPIDLQKRKLNTATFGLNLASIRQEFIVSEQSSGRDMFCLFAERREKKVRTAALSRRNWLTLQDGPFASIIKADYVKSLASDIEFHFAFGENLALRRTQRGNGQCIFCGAHYRDVESFVVHLACDHDFVEWTFDFKLGKGLVIALIANPAVPVISVLPDSSTIPKPRRYVHSDTCEALMPYEMDEDSEDDLDESWTHERTEMLLDQFEDVSDEETLMMKYWNRHVRFNAHNRQVTDVDMPELCESFVRENRAMLLPIKRELLVHLFNLWDMGLITKEWILKCLEHLQR